MNPSSLEALSLQAAMALLDDRTADFDALVAQVLAINPRYGEVYRVAGAAGGAPLPLRRAPSS